MPPLITREEALQLGELDGPRRRSRRWSSAPGRRAQERFGDSTDMCSLVNAKSGGCAEDCGFCAQSRFAEAETPMHAMMEPEQILEHARAAEAAGAHRFCMVTQGQGLSKRDFEKVLEGARLVAEHTNLKRCASIGHMSAARAKALQARPASSACTTTSRRPSPTTTRSPSTVRYEGRLRTIDAVREAGLETCVGGILNLGESREQRVEMAFELAEIDPTSRADQPAQPAPGHEVRRPRLHGPVGGGEVDRDLPPHPARRAVPPLRRARREPRRAAAAGRQGRAQRRDDGQLPHDARQHARGGPRDVRRARASTSPASPTTAPTRGPTTARAGWTARRPTSSRSSSTRAPSADADLEVRLWDPATQLRFSARRIGARRDRTARRTAGRAKRPDGQRP